MSRQDIRVGACEMIFNGVDLGTTAGGVTLSLGFSAEPSKALGVAPSNNSIISATSGTVRANFAEASLDNLSRLSVGSMLTSDLQKRKLMLYDMTGAKLRDYARKLVIKPLNAESQNDWIIAPLAAPVMALDMSFVNTALRTIPVTFHLMSDLPRNPHLVTFGYESFFDQLGPGVVIPVVPEIGPIYFGCLYIGSSPPPIPSYDDVVANGNIILTNANVTSAAWGVNGNTHEFSVAAPALNAAIGIIVALPSSASITMLSYYDAITGTFIPAYISDQDIITINFKQYRIYQISLTSGGLSSIPGPSTVRIRFSAT